MPERAGLLPAIESPKPKTANDRIVCPAVAAAQVDRLVAVCYRQQNIRGHRHGNNLRQGSITGKSANRAFDFLVDTGATWVGIPQDDIDALGLDAVPNAGAALMTADGKVLRSPIYVGIGMLEGTGFVNGVVPAAVPLVGYKLLQDLGFKVDLVNERIGPRPDREVGPPFLWITAPQV